MILSPLWPAHAGNKPQPPNSSASAGAVANSGSYAKSQSQSASVAGAAANVTGVSALAKGGEASAMGGNATAEALGGEGGSSDISGGVHVSDRAVRQAPAVFGMVGDGNGVDCMVGWGGGGSNKTGGITLGATVMQKECYSLLMFDRLAGMGLNDPAAKAFCKPKGHWWPFESRENCEASIVQTLISMEIDRAEVAAAAKKQMPKVSPIQKWLRLQSLK